MKNRYLKIIGAIIIAYALLGFLIIPAVVQWQLPKNMNTLLKANTTVQSVYFNPFTFKFKLNGLKVTQEDKTLISFKELYLDFSLLKSLHNTHIAFKHIELSNLVINVVQNKQGEINLLSILPPSQPNTSEQTSKKQSNSVIPFKIAKTVLDNASINLTLENGDEPIHANLKNLNYTFYDLGTYKNSLASHSLNTMLNKETTIKVDGGFYLMPFNMYGKIAINNLHTSEYLPYKKELLNFTPSDALLNIQFGYHLDLRKNLEAKIENLNIELKKLSLEQNKTTFASFNAFEVQNANIYYPQQKVQIESINLQQPFAHAIIDNKGELNFANLVHQTKEQTKKESQENNIKEASTTNTNKPWLINIDDINVNNANVKFDDVKNKIKLSTSNINVNVNNNTIENENITSKAIKVGFEKLQLQDKKNSTSVLLKEYLLQLSNIKKEQETISVGQINVAQAYAAINNKAANVVAQKINLRIDDVFNKGNYIKVKKSLLHQPKLAITVKKTPSSKKENKKVDTTKQPTKKATTQKSKPAMNLDFGPFNINKARITFEDKNLPIPFKTTISKLHGNFSEFITKSTKPTKLNLEGQVDQYGYTKITGFVDHKNIKNLTDVEMLFKNIAIKNFTPYSGKFVGRELDAGKLNLNLKYNITKSNIDAKNSIVITDIKLGKQVQSPDAMSLPLELAIALMEDTNGVIDLNIPISGNVDDPQFSIAPIVWKAFTNLIVKAITSPFRFLASLFDFDEEELKSLEFAFGQSQLIASEKETLDKIAKIFAKRPKIALKVQPAYHLENDTLAIQTQKLEAVIDAKVKTIKKGEDKYLMALEQTYMTIKEVKPLKELKKMYQTKENKLDRYAYAEYLKNFLIPQQKVSKQELEQLATKRSQSISDYFKTAHNIDAHRILINKAIKNSVESKEWTQFDLEIGLKQ